MKGVTGDESEVAAAAANTYVERSLEPLNPHGWTTFRRVGCFSREDRDPRQQENNHERHQNFMHRQDLSDPNRQLFGVSGPVILRYSDRTPEGCAAHCSFKKGGGIGFFGISNGDG